MIRSNEELDHPTNQIDHGEADLGFATRAIHHGYDPRGFDW
ncbi:hypothetical protein [Mesorhizobium sp. WSM3626]|nr:hypothetical protein [Mesorhizobium sp. WSM3626]